MNDSVYQFIDRSHTSFEMDIPPLQVYSIILCFVM